MEGKWTSQIGAAEVGADAECYPPPIDPSAFESLCLDLWKEIWCDSGAQKNKRSGRSPACVDILGISGDLHVGVQCRKPDGLLRTELTASELKEEVSKALEFRPSLSGFIVVTTGPVDAKVQLRAREISADHKGKGRFTVEVWSWSKIWREIKAREALFQRISPIYWPHAASVGKQRIAPSCLTHTAANLFGRSAEIAMLDEKWSDPQAHIVTLVAWGGVGKTSLIARFQAQLAARDFDGADYFDWSFHCQGKRDRGGASADSFVDAALRFFGGSEMAQTSASAWEKGARLTTLVSRRRTLLVLDGLEQLQHPPGPLAGQLKDPAVSTLLKGLARENPGLCVVTTRESVKDLDTYQGTTASEWKLDKLTGSIGVELLKSLGVRGADSEFEELVKDVDGHALTLRLLGTYLARAHRGNIRRRDQLELGADHKVQGGYAFKTIATYASWLGESGEEGAQQLAILRLLGLFDRPAEIDCIGALLDKPVISELTEPLIHLDKEVWNHTVDTLEECGLVNRTPTYQSTALDVHPLIREYFADRLRERNPDAWRIAHSRLFDYLTKTAEYQPDTLEGLQPLYQSIFHGCHSGRYEEVRHKVFHDRILRGSEFYSTKKLGAISSDLDAVANFFESPWDKLPSDLTEEAQAWLRHYAATKLGALGRLAEALEPMLATLSRDLRKGELSKAATTADNVSELQILIGDTLAAQRTAEQAVRLASRIGDVPGLVGSLARLADISHQGGDRAKALVLFRKAEIRLVEAHPQYTLLFGLGGFQYCDLLLAEAERAAWRADTTGEQIETCCGVLERVSRTLQIAQRLGLLLDIALDHLTLGRAKLYRSILGDSDPTTALPEIEEAVHGLRKAGHREELPKGLLTRAWYRALIGDEAGARIDLDEAWDVAEPGPMPLYQTDIHLYRARLFKDPESLAEARRFIEMHSYNRRLGELEDAERVASGW